MGKRKSDTEKHAPEHAGTYFLDGQWNPEDDPPTLRDPSSSLYWFVDMLITKRRQDPGCPPWHFAQRINQSRFAVAFPTAVSIDTNNRSRWTAMIHVGEYSFPIPFFAVATRTPAEEAVRVAGCGAEKDALVRIAEAEIHARPDIPVDENLVREWLSGAGV